MSRLRWPPGAREEFDRKCSRVDMSRQFFLNAILERHFGCETWAAVIPLDDWDVLRVQLPFGQGMMVRAREDLFLAAADDLHRTTWIPIVDYGAWVGTHRVRWIPGGEISIVPPWLRYATPARGVVRACAAHEDCLGDADLARACWLSTHPEESRDSPRAP